jgi:hypothetical protein
LGGHIFSSGSGRSRRAKIFWLVKEHFLAASAGKGQKYLQIPQDGEDFQFPGLRSTALPRTEFGELAEKSDQSNNPAVKRCDGLVHYLIKTAAKQAYFETE